MSKFWLGFLVLMSLVLVLAGCGSATTVAPVASATPTRGPTVLEPSPTAWHDPTATPAPTHTPTPESEIPALPSLGDIWVRGIDGMHMVFVPAGQFQMGADDPIYNNERPAHMVSLESFWMDQNEVNTRQYQECVQAGDCTVPIESGSFTRLRYYDNGTHDDYPVIFVTWNQAASYCAWADARLPTEEEWEYAARGPESWIHPWGNQPDASRLNYCDANCRLPHSDSSTDDGYSDTAPVGQYQDGASWCGALDMLGNVWEWVEDWFAYYPSEINPSWLHVGDVRVIRGGGWDTSFDHARSSFRNFFDPTGAHDSIGFRCVFSEFESTSSSF